MAGTRDYTLVQVSRLSLGPIYPPVPLVMGGSLMHIGDHSPPTVLMLRMSGTIPVLPPYAILVYTDYQASEYSTEI
jgi:hypothetical protein